MFGSREKQVSWGWPSIQPTEPTTCRGLPNLCPRQRRTSGSTSCLPRMALGGYRTASSAFSLPLKGLRTHKSSLRGSLEIDFMTVEGSLSGLTVISTSPLETPVIQRGPRLRRRLGGRSYASMTAAQSLQRIPLGVPYGLLGHRNPQGVAWDAEGRLWSTEHGRSGLQSGFDELNLIRDGENYGWPIVQGDDEVVPYRSPAMHSGEAHTWAPSGIASIGGRLFFGGLRGEALFEVAIEGESVSGLVGHFASELGRIRSVVAGPDGMLYFTTSNRDGRGARRDGDDKVLRVDPVLLRR